MLYHLYDIYWVVFDIFINSFHDLLIEEDEEYHKLHLLNFMKYNHLCLFHNFDHFLKVLLNLLNVLELIPIKLQKQIFFQFI